MIWERDEDIKLLLAEEQTLLSRERTMHSYMQTGLAFTSVGLVVMKFLSGIFYFCAGGGFHHPWSPPDCRVWKKVYAVQESHRQVKGKGGKAWV